MRHGRPNVVTAMVAWPAVPEKLVVYGAAMLLRSAVLLSLTACASYTPPPKPVYLSEHQPTFEAFRGEPIAVELVDLGALYTHAPGLVLAAKRGVEQQLTDHGVTLTASAPRTMRFDLSKASNRHGNDEAMMECVHVSGRVQASAKQFVPTQDFTAEACRSSASHTGPSDPLSAAILATMLAVDAVANQQHSNDQKTNDQAAALSAALGDVMAQIDAQSRYGK